MSKPQGPIYKSPTAKDLPFDPTADPACGLTSEFTEEAIFELCNKAAIAASPGYSFGREGTHNANTWLIAAESLSSKRGLPFGLNNGVLTKITTATRFIPDAYEIKVYYHSGNSVGLTLLTTVTTNGTTATQDFVVNVPVPKGVQIAVRIGAVGSIKPQETGVFLVIEGTKN